MVIRKTLLFIVVLILCVPAMAFAAPDVSLTPEGKVPGTPFDYLQGQIDNIQLTPGPQGPQGEPGPIGP